MMIHPPQKRPQVAEGAFNLTREGKLPSRMDIFPVGDRPPAVNVPVYASAIRLETRLGTHVLCQELEGVATLDVRRDNRMGEFPTPDLLAEHERAAVLPAEERLIELYGSFEERVLLRKLGPEEGERSADRGVAQTAERHGLSNGNLLRPAPEEGPEGAV